MHFSDKIRRSPSSENRQQRAIASVCLSRSASAGGRSDGNSGRTVARRGRGRSWPPSAKRGVGGRPASLYIARRARAGTPPSIEEVREDFDLLTEHIARAIRLSLSLCHRAIWLVLARPLRFLRGCLAAAAAALVAAFKLIVALFVALYLAFRYVFPAQRRDPLSQSKKLQRAKIWDAIVHHERALLIGLNKTLVYCTALRPPRRAGFARVRVPSSGGATVYVKPRPHLARFLHLMAQHFQIFVFSAYGQIAADAIVAAIDRSNLVYGILSRKDMRRVGRRLYRSAAALQREAGKTLIVDCDESAVLEREVFFGVSPFYGRGDDDELLKLGRFLRDGAAAGDSAEALARRWKPKSAVCGLAPSAGDEPPILRSN